MGRKGDGESEGVGEGVMKRMGDGEMGGFGGMNNEEFKRFKSETIQTVTLSLSW